MTLQNYLNKTEKYCREYFETFSFDFIRPKELKLGTLEYFKRGGKRLRPAVLILSACVAGGEKYEKAVIPAACATELFHTFTLIHDDIIDNDPVRRGGKSVHTMISDMFSQEGYSKSKCDEYGRDVAILSGDMLHSLAVNMMLKTADCKLFSPKTVIGVTQLMENECLSEVLEGETLDTRAGLMEKDFSVSEENFGKYLTITQKKTAVLFSYAAKAGAMLALDCTDEKNGFVSALSDFAYLCGVAFQLQDDILGINADEKKLGKPTGSDIREGKKTLILQNAYNRCDLKERKLIEKVVGNRSASNEDTENVKKIFEKTGAIETVKSLANEYTEKALKKLSVLPDSSYLETLKEWALFMSERSL